MIFLMREKQQQRESHIYTYSVQRDTLEYQLKLSVVQVKCLVTFNEVEPDANLFCLRHSILNVLVGLNLKCTGSLHSSDVSI